METMLTRRDVLAGGIVLASTMRQLRPRAKVLDSLLDQRRMVRRFTDDPVDDATIDELLSAAIRAPSAGDLQPWAFVVVRDPKRRKELARAALGQMFVADAPVLIVACAELERSRKRYRERGNQYAIIDTAFASLLLLLAVTELGLGACFVGAFEDADVARILRLPRDVQPLAIIPVGHPAERPPGRKRRPRKELVHYEKW